MKVKELIEILQQLNPEQEIRYDSYEFTGDFEIEQIEELEYENTKYYNII